MSRQLMLCLIAAGGILPCQASDLGIGVTMGGPGTTIYVPWKIKPDFQLEGTVSYDRSHSSATFNDGMNGYSSSTTRVGVGLGAFWVRPLTESTRLNLGSRLEYSVSKTRWMPSMGETKANHYGLSLAPTLGIEYFPIKAVSLGGEAGLRHTRTHSSYSENSFGPNHEERSETFTALIVRYYF